MSVRQCFYSVPAGLAGRRVTVRLSATTVQICEGDTVVAEHERAVGKFVEVLCLDHYLEVLQIKPGALPGRPRWSRPAAPGCSPRRTSALGRRPRRPGRHGRHPGAGRGTAGAPHLPADALAAAFERAAAAGISDPNVVIIDARRAAAGHAAPVLPIGELARYDRPAPCLSDYDRLLTGSHP